VELTFIFFNLYSFTLIILIFFFVKNNTTIYFYLIKLRLFTYKLLENFYLFYFLDIYYLFLLDFFSKLMLRAYFIYIMDEILGKLFIVLKSFFIFIITKFCIHHILYYTYTTLYIIFKIFFFKGNRFL